MKKLNINLIKKLETRKPISRMEGFTTYIYPGVKKIPAGYFAEDMNLHKIVIPSSVKKIGNDAFRDCFLIFLYIFFFFHQIAASFANLIHCIHTKKIELPQLVQLVQLYF